ncbi:multicopper oxidase [Ramaria rubella]|nr:multicopper oxidase [Ramaria rubella]
MGREDQLHRFQPATTTALHPLLNMRAISAAALLLFSGMALARVRHYTLNVADGLVAPDGFERSAVTVNGITPGPILIATKGDTMIVNVTNCLRDPFMRRSTTIHWHGIYQRGWAQDDGPAGVTQCPIAPENFYAYHLELGEQAGTYWYHSHLSTQYIDGLRGPLIIYDPEDPHRHLYDIDDPTTIITMTDWYQQYTEQLAADWIANITAEPVPDSNLMNGVGRYSGGPPVKRAVITVQQGKRYRFRLINMSAMVPFRFAVEDHPFTVIEVDGVNHQPITATSLSISAGQRYSVVLTANQRVANYWIAYPSKFLGDTTTATNPDYNGTEAYAVLSYQGAPNGEPVTPQLVVQRAGMEGGSGALQEYQLKPLVNPTPPGGDRPDVVVKLNFTTTRPGGSTTPGVGNKWLVNGAQYITPKIPTLLQILSGHTNMSDFGRNEDTYVLPVNKSIEVQLIGDADHPFHLHGHVFSVIQSATGPKNLIDPPIRDTVDTNDDLQNPVTIRFRTDNPGPWFLHSHKDWHLEAGLAVVFAEDPEDQRRGPQSLNPSAAWNQLCPIYNALPKELQ